MTREQAEAILRQWTVTEPLLRHARAVELVMRDLARRLGGDEEQWGLAGLLHDADYEAFPDEHPRHTVALLRERGEEALARAVAAHYTAWGASYDEPMERALVACDELTGFVGACCRVHPEGIRGLTVASVLKKFRQKSFAAKVEREEMHRGAAILGVPIEQLAEWIIDVLRAHRDELGLP